MSRTATPTVRLSHGSAIEDRVAASEGRLQILEERLRELGATLHELTIQGELFAKSPVTEGWKFHAANKNIYFNNVYKPEHLQDGSYKRWVDQTGRLSLTIFIPRRIPYTFTIDIVDFADSDYEKHFVLLVDGDQAEWDSYSDRRYTATIPTRANSQKIDLELLIPAEILQVEKPVSFSFSSISLSKV